MKNHRLLLLLTLSFIPFVAFSQHTSLYFNHGDTLKIIEVKTNTQTVTIDGAPRTIGYCFTIDSNIDLNKGDYIIVDNLSTGCIDITICGDELAVTRSSRLSTYIQKRMAGNKGYFDGFGSFLEEYSWFIVEDTLYIPTDYFLDNQHGFFLKTITENRYLKRAVPFDTKTNELVFTKDYFLENGIHFTPGQKYQFRVEYWEGHNKSEFITDKFFLEYIEKR